MNMNLRLARVMLVVPVVFSGCSLPYLSSTPMNRTAYVSRIYSKDDLRLNRPSCLSHLTTEEIESRQFVEIRRQVGRLTKILSAELPLGTQIKVRDRVAISSGTCANNLIPKIERLIEN